MIQSGDCEFCGIPGWMANTEISLIGKGYSTNICDECFNEYIIHREEKFFFRINRSRKPFIYNGNTLEHRTIYVGYAKE